MRKLLSFLLIFNLAHATAPTGYKNETATAKTYAQDLVFPNNQLTKQPGLDSRIETGNTNLLVNPSFEHSTVTTGWTITNATATADTTNQVEGKKALSLSLTGALDVYQDSTVNAANLVGLQGNASIKIKTSDVDGLKVCARNAGVTSTSLCINIPKDGAWKEINIPNILNATSNGIAITSTGTSGTVKLDDAFIGTSAPFQSVNGAKLMGTLKYSNSGNLCEWTLTSSTFANFSADTDCPTPAITGAIQAPATKIPAFVFPSGSPAGTYYIVAKGMFYVANGNYSNWRFSDGTNSSDANIGYQNTNSLGSIVGQITYSTSIASNTTINIQMKNNGGESRITANNLTDGLSFEVYYFPPQSKIYSSRAEIPIMVGAKTSGQALTANVTDVTFTALKDNRSGWSGSSYTVKEDGDYNISAMLSDSASNNFAVYVYKNGTLYKQLFYVYNGQRFSGSLIMPNLVVGDTISIRVSLSITTGADGNLAINKVIGSGTEIVGSFAGIEKCANDYECTDTFSAQVVTTTGVITSQNIPWLASCTAANPSVCTLNTNLKDGVSGLSSPMNCTATAQSSGGAITATIASPSTTGFNVVSSAGSTGVWVKCQKGTNDYKPKTAKVASSIGVPTVQNPGTKAYDFISVSYGTANATTVCSASPCSYLDQIGSGSVSSITRSGTGAYTLNVGKTYSKLKCMSSTSTAGQGGVIVTSSCSSCNALSFSTLQSTSGASIDTFGSLMCIGEY